MMLAKMGSGYNLDVDFRLDEGSDLDAGYEIIAV